MNEVRETDARNPGYYSEDIRSTLRRLERLEVKHPTNEPTSTHKFPLKWDLTGELQFEAFFLESVYTGLLTDEPLIALRCAFQAFGYIHQFSASSYDQDRLLALRHRCEAFLKGG